MVSINGYTNDVYIIAINRVALGKISRFTPSPSPAAKP
jgi:hypothetical protein